jgi:rhodanese-related sulfurtransferase
VYCPYDELDNNLADLPRDRKIVVADAVGLRSKEVVDKLIGSGFLEVYNLAGGIVEWERSGLPVTTDKSRILTGSCMCQLRARNKKKD